MDVIVVGVDGSEPSQRAVLWAADEAAWRGCALKVVLAVAEQRGGSAHLTADLTPQATQITDRARELAHTSHPDLDVGGAPVVGHPAKVLVDESEGADLVVVGSRGHGGFHDMLLGSTSLHAAMHAHCPVAVVRRPSGAGHDRAPVVVGVDGSASSQAAAELAAYEADLRGAPLTVLHAWPSGADEALGPWALVGQTGVLDAEPAGVAEEAAAAVRAVYVQAEVTARTVRRRPAGALLAESKRACLVVVGCRGHGGFAGLLLGSVSQALVHHAGCPVLVNHRHDT
ncbi:universal stress protein [Catellatospora sichuanensis]|uniref:universal stress protein n=1 Tax=Catellatospora sichuanensis TaxID=1969805 RepID=UPI001C922454|nr:universal stress protein [Catellatospora sichuanensis]